jgi:hypothetical protein
MASGEESRSNKGHGHHETVIKATETQKGERISKDAGMGNRLGNPEWVPTYNIAPAEKKIAQYKNSYILLGGDRFASAQTGYGGLGSHECAAIDLVAGIGQNPTKFSLRDKQAAEDIDTARIIGTGPTGIPIVNIMYDKNFISDSARVYISEKADIDRYFNIDTEGTKNRSRIINSEGRSAVGIKADAVRIIGREGIRLVTRTESRNSQDGKIEFISGIELMAGGDPDGLQPFVKGDNMVRALQKLASLLQQVVRDVVLLGGATEQMSRALADHFHPTTGFPGITPGTAVSLNGGPFMSSMPLVAATINRDMTDLRATGKRIGFGWRKTYTSPGGQYYINSYFNRVN